MRRLALLVFSLVPFEAPAEQLACRIDASFQGGGSVSGSLRLVLKGRRPVGLAISLAESHVQATGNPLAIWTAALDTTNRVSVGTQRWSTNGSTTTLRLSDPGGTDADTLIRLVRTENGFRVLLDAVSGYYRGMAATPTAITISRNKRTCVASFPLP